MKTFAAFVLAASLSFAEGAAATPAPLDVDQRPVAETPEGAVEVASYFSFMRSFKRICYTYATGYVYC